MRTSNQIVKCILGNERKRLPIKLIDSFEVKTKADRYFITKKLAQVPFFVRIEVRNEFNRMAKSKNISLKGAKVFLKQLAIFCSDLPVNVTITIKQLHMHISEIVQLCTKYKKNFKKGSISNFDLLKKIEKLIALMGLSPRKGKSLFGDINRYCSPKWWSRKLKCLYLQSKERVAHYLRLVNDKLDKYLTSENFDILRENRARNQVYFDSLVATDELDTKLNFSDVVSSSLANPKNRKAEIVTRLKGSEKYAEKYGYKSDLITFTCPSKYHAVSHPNIKNANYDNSSIWEAKEYLTKQWARIRTKLQKLNVDYYGFRVVEPHHDGTPHWHLIIFSKENQRQCLHDCIQNHIVKGATHKQHLLDIKPVDKKKGSAEGYLVKNITEKVDFTGKKNIPSSEELSRINEWGTLWKVHQFEPFGGPKAGMWREARRIAMTAQVDDSPIWKIVKGGDWLAFFEFTNQPKVDGSKSKISLYKKFDDSLNEFGEERGILVKGLIIDDKVYFSRQKKWEINVKSGHF
mgnify:CR=1 FL=1